MKNITIFIILLLFNFFSINAQPVEIGVPAGSDLEQVRNQVRALNDDMSDDIIIYLEGGRYFLTKALEFDSADSSSNGHRIIWRNKENEQPEISGGVEITNWKVEGNGTISANIPDGFRFRQLYVNGQKAVRAKFPNDTYVRLHYDNTGKRFIVSQSVAQNYSIIEWNQIENVEVNFVNTFVTSQVKIDSVVYDATSTNTLIYINESCASILDQSYEHDFDVLFENAHEFVDEPGEWYLDEQSDILYYKVRPGETITNVDVIAPKVERLVNIADTKGLVFFGLCFEHSSWTRPGEYGFVGIQNLYRTNVSGGFPYNFPIPAAIHVQRSNEILFERNIIRYTGGTGVMADDDALCNLALVGNVFYETAASAIELGDDDKKGARLPEQGLYQPVVQNNYFYKAGIQYGSTVVFGTFPFQLDFKHNEMVHSNAMGLNLGWGGLTSKDLFYRPIVEYNKFDSICMQSTDAAVFHTRNHSYGSKISNNWFDHTTKVADSRFLGRYNNNPNDPKFGNMYLDNDAKDNNLIGNIHTNLNLNDYSGTLDGYYIFGAKSSPNYILSSDENSVLLKSGLTSDYQDIKGYLFSGSIGGNKLPGKHYLASYLLDDRDTLICYKGDWVTESSGGTDLGTGGYLNTYTTTTTNNDAASITFTGEGIGIFGPVSSSLTTVAIYLDGTIDTTISLKGDNLVQHKWYQNTSLDYGDHTVDIVKVSGDKLRLDGFEIFQSKESGKTSFNEIVQDYENISTDSLPSDHTTILEPGTTISVKEVGSCDARKLVIDDLSDTTGAKISIPFTPIKGITYCRFDIEPLQDSAKFYISLMSKDSAVIKVLVDSDRYIKIYDGSKLLVLQPYAADSTYRMEIAANNYSKIANLRINGQAFGPYNFKLSSEADIDTFNIFSPDETVGKLHFDNLIINNKPIPEPLLPLDDNCNEINLIQDYESNDPGTVPSDHTVATEGDALVEVQVVGGCKNQKLVIDNPSVSSTAEVSVPFEPLNETAYWRFDIKAQQNNSTFHFDLRDGASAVIKISVGNDGNFRIFNGSVSTVVVAYNADTTYRVEVIADNINKTTDLKINGQTFGPYNFKISTKTDLDNMRILSFTNSVGSIYFDNLVISGSPISESLLPINDCDNVGDSTVVTSISGDEALKKSLTTRYNMSVFPNPTIGTVNLIIPIENQKDEVVTSLFDLNGRLVNTKTHSLCQGQNKLSLNYTGIDSGCYILRVRNQKLNYSQKLLIEPKN